MNQPATKMIWAAAPSTPQCASPRVLPIVLPAATHPTPVLLALCQRVLQRRDPALQQVIRRLVAHMPDAEDLARKRAVVAADGHAARPEACVEGRPVDAVGHLQGGDGRRRILLAGRV